MCVSIKKKDIASHSMICSWPSSCLLEILLALSKSKCVCRFVTHAALGRHGNDSGTAKFGQA